MTSCRAFALLIPFVCFACAKPQPTTGPTPGTQAPDLGHPPQQVGQEDFTFDSHTRQFDATSEFPQNTRVRVVVSKINPFLYEYRIRANGQEVQQPSISDFFKAIGVGITLPAANGSGGAREALASATQPTTGSPNPLYSLPGGEYQGSGQVSLCSSAGDAAWQQFTQRVDEAIQTDSAITHAFKRIGTLTRSQEREVVQARDRYLNPASEPVAVHAAALAVSGKLGEAIDSLTVFGEQFGPTIDGFTRGLADLSAQTRRELLTHPGCPTVVGYAAAVQALLPDTSLFRANLEAVTAKNKQLSNALRQMTPLLDPGRYYATELIRRFDKPADVTVTISRRTAATTDSFSTVGSQRFHIGGDARFAIAAGMAWNSIGRQSFGISKRYTTPPPGNPGDTIVATVVQTEQSSWRVFPFVTFITRFNSAWWVPQPFIGAGISNVSSDPRPGFLLGTAFEITPDFMLTAGGFAGSEDHLEDGLKPGDRLPGSLTSPPVQSRWRVGLSFGLAYRVL